MTSVWSSKTVGTAARKTSLTCQTISERTFRFRRLRRRMARAKWRVAATMLSAWWSMAACACPREMCLTVRGDCTCILTADLPKSFTSPPLTLRRISSRQSSGDASARRALPPRGRQNGWRVTPRGGARAKRTRLPHSLLWANAWSRACRSKAPKAQGQCSPAQHAQATTHFRTLGRSSMGNEGHAVWGQSLTE